MILPLLFLLLVQSVGLERGREREREGEREREREREREGGEERLDCNIIATLNTQSQKAQASQK